MREKTFKGKISTTGGGLGFFQADGFDEDIRIETKYLNTALNGDTVVIKVRPRSGRKQASGEVIDVLERAKTRFVGVIQKDKNICLVVPDDRKMYADILISEKNKLNTNDKVLVELEDWSDPAKDPEGKILQILGKKGDHETEIASIVLERGIDTKFPDNVESEAQSIKSDWKKNGSRYISKSIKLGDRRDFRDTTTFTIDPVDAKDFDDALSINPLENGSVEVGIHIADVAHYVEEGTHIDKEAVIRGFSVYLVDRTIPMLPEALSNNLCSLNPNTDRLSFSVVLEIDPQGGVTNRWFGRGVIHSDKRFSYEDAQVVLNKKTGPFREELTLLNNLATLLRDRRFQKGAIDFEQDEVEIELDDTGKPKRIYKKQRLETHKLVEEFMLLANREVAEKIYKAHGKKNIERGFIYRVHDLPDEERLEELANLVRALGYSIDSSNISSKAINALFEDIADSPAETLIKTAMIRSMSRAIYATKNIGHFGLGFKYYTHFTSPIRRYSDLLVHRMLDLHLKGRGVPTGKSKLYKTIATELSEKESDIQGAERDSIKYKQVEYMAERIGKHFEGVISGITEWGVYVALSETGAEGLIRLRDISDDHYRYEQKRYRLVGEKTGKTYTLGDVVEVKIVNADIDRKTLDFVLV